MSKLDSTEIRDHSDHSATPKPKSAAASRILRAVEKSRVGEGPVKGEQPDGAATTTQNESPKHSEPVITARTVEPEEGLRTLSESQTAAAAAIKTNPKVAAEPIVSPPPAAKPVVAEVKPVAEIKPKVTEQKASEIPAAVAKETATPVVQIEAKPQPKVEAKPAAASVVVESKAPSSDSPKAKNGKKNGKEAENGSAKSKNEPKPQPAAVVEERADPVDSKQSATAAPVFEAPVLGMGPNPSQSFWANIPVALKAIVLIGVIGGGAGLAYKFVGKATPDAKKPSQSSKAKPVLVPMSGVGGWSANWGGDVSRASGRSISLFRESAQHEDYRIEFQGQIENKGFGWVFRAKDPQNYYGYKVEIVKPGLQPLVALARLTVVGGVESQKHYTLLEKPMRPDTVFRVRMDAKGTEFTTWINDQLIEVWQDDKISSGGVGLFNEKDERAQIRKVQIFEMR